MIRTMKDGPFLWISKSTADVISATLGSSALLVYLWLYYYASYADQYCFSIDYATGQLSKIRKIHLKFVNAIIIVILNLI